MMVKESHLVTHAPQLSHLHIQCTATSFVHNNSIVLQIGNLSKFNILMLQQANSYKL